MLVISRRKGQSITIGDEIELVITELHRSVVKIGIRAPRGTTVLRGEVRDSIAQANQSAAQSAIEGTVLDTQLQGFELSIDLSAIAHPTDPNDQPTSTTAPPSEAAVESGWQKLSRSGLIPK